MAELYKKYFSNVRWVELLMTMALAAGLYLSSKAKDSGELRFSQDDWLEAGGAALGAGWAYLRIPKGADAQGLQESAQRAEAEYPLNLPPRIDPSLEVIKALVAGGMPENLARVMVATDFEAAARYAKGASDGI
jgi:hypothetical protein